MVRNLVNLNPSDQVQKSMLEAAKKTNTIIICTYGSSIRIKRKAVSLMLSDDAAKYPRALSISSGSCYGQGTECLHHPFRKAKTPSADHTNIATGIATDIFSSSFSPANAPA